MSILDFSGSYQPPGVYVQQQISQVISVPVTVPSVVALVGPARGYYSNTDAMVLNGSSYLPLSQNGVNVSTIVVSNAYGTVFNNTNYQTQVTGSGTTSVVGIELTTSGVTNIGSTVVYVTYQYTNNSYYQPLTFTSYNQIAAAYGNPFDASGNLTSPISLAAQFLYANGNPTVVVMPTTDTGFQATRAGLSSAYTALVSNENIDLVVPLPVGLTGTPVAPGDIYNVGQDLKTHCDTLANQGLYRMGLYGYETTCTITPDLVAQNILDQRVVVAYPNQFRYFYGPNNATYTIGGYYAAAAFAGFLSSNPVQQGLTRQVINGFSGIPNSLFITMTRQVKNTWSASGASVIEVTGNGALVCRQGVTTNPSSVVTQEISVVRAADLMMWEIQSTLDNSGLIGSPTTVDTPNQVQTVVQAVLDNLASLGAIVSYGSLNAVVSSTNPTVITVTFQYSPSFPLNYIAVQFSVNTTSGTVSTTTPAAA